MNLRSRLRRLHRDERGQTILFFALMFVVLLGFTAMVTDTGIAYWNRRMIQNGVDSAALAGAVALSQAATTPTAIAAAGTYAESNGIQAGELLCNSTSSAAIAGCPTDATPSDANYEIQVTSSGLIPGTNDEVVVSARRSDDFGLRYIVGAGSANDNIAASAAAIIVPVSPGNNEIWPWGLENSATEPCYQGLGSYGLPPTNPTQCFLQSDKLSSGNWGQLSLSCRGGKCYKSDIIGGFVGTVPTPVSTNPPAWNWQVDGGQGIKAGPTGQGTSVRLGWDDQEACVNGAPKSCANLYQPSPGAGQNPDPYWPSPDTNGEVCIKTTACPRVGLIPILSDTYGNGNSSPVHIKSFQCFYLSYADDKTVEGFFLGSCTPSYNGSQMQGFYGQQLDSTGLVGVFLWR